MLVPTRELAVQVSEAIHKYGRELGTRVLPIYGGQSYQPQLSALKRGVHVVVGTPGRVIDHLERGSLDLPSMSCSLKEILAHIPDTWDSALGVNLFHSGARVARLYVPRRTDE